MEIPESSTIFKSAVIPIFASSSTDSLKFQIANNVNTNNTLTSSVNKIYFATVLINEASEIGGFGGNDKTKNMLYLLNPDAQILPPATTTTLTWSGITSGIQANIFLDDESKEFKVKRTGLWVVGCQILTNVVASTLDHPYIELFAVKNDTDTTKFGVYRPVNTQIFGTCYVIPMIFDDTFSFKIKNTQPDGQQVTTVQQNRMNAYAVFLNTGKTNSLYRSTPSSAQLLNSNVTITNINWSGSTSLISNNNDISSADNTTFTVSTKGIYFIGCQVQVTPVNNNNSNAIKEIWVIRNLSDTHYSISRSAPANIISTSGLVFLNSGDTFTIQFFSTTAFNTVPVGGNIHLFATMIKAIN